MAENIVNYKFTESLENSEGEVKEILADDLVLVNKAFGDSAAEGDEKFGSIYKGDKLVGTTEADKLVLTDDLDVIGVTVGSAGSGKKFAKGTDIYTVLRQILQKEIGVTATNPTATLTNSGTAAGKYEVGTSISPVLAGKFTDGKFTGQSGYTYTLAAGCAAGTPEFYRGTTKLSDNTDTQVLSNGAINYSCKIPYSASTNKPVSNMGTELSTSISAGTATSSNITFTGAYKYFIGCYSDSVFDEKVYNTASIRTDDVVKSDFMNGTTIDYSITVPAGTKGMYIAIPAGVDDSGASLVVKQTTALNSPVNEEMAANKRTLTINCAGSATKEYIVFTWSFPGGTEGAETFAITKF